MGSFIHTASKLSGLQTRISVKQPMKSIFLSAKLDRPHQPSHHRMNTAESAIFSRVFRRLLQGKNEEQRKLTRQLIHQVQNASPPNQKVTTLSSLKIHRRYQQNPSHHHLKNL